MHRAVSLHEIISHLDNELDVSRYTEDEPSNGLMIDAGQPVMRIAAAVNTSFATIRGAAAAGAQLLLVHHATWQGVDHYLKAEKEEALRVSGVSLYGAHAALDCAEGTGNADVLAGLLGVEVEGRFLQFAGGTAGVYGRCDGTFAEFVERSRAALEVEPEAWTNSESFGRVAVVPGGGGMTGFLDEARRLGCDTYLTGEGSMYTKLFAREAGMNLVYATHYATEAPGIRALADRTADRFGLPWSFVPEFPGVL